MSDKTFGFLMFAVIAGIIIAGASISVASYAGAIPAIIIFLLGAYCWRWHLCIGKAHRKAHQG